MNAAGPNTTTLSPGEKWILECTSVGICNRHPVLRTLCMCALFTCMYIMLFCRYGKTAPFGCHESIPCLIHDPSGASSLPLVGSEARQPHEQLQDIKEETTGAQNGSQ